MPELDVELQQLKSLDLNAAMAYVQEDRDLLITLAVKYMAVTGLRIRQMEQCLMVGHLEEAKKIAHTVKGASGYVGAQRMGRLMQIMQSMSAVNAAKSHLAEIRREYALLAAAYQEEFGSDLSAEDQSNLLE